MRRWMVGLMTACTASVAIAAAQTSPQAPAAPARGAAAPAAKPLDIYVVDTEGGKAALWISPTGQTVLIDSGNPGNRDLDRLMAAVQDAGVTKIDYLISTHYHVDHIGGMAELAKRLPIGTFVDHGPSVEAREQVQGFQATYAELYNKAKHIVVKPGDRVPVTGLDWRIVTAGGQALKTPLVGAGQTNALCTAAQMKDPNPTDENSQSVGSVVTLGQFKAIDLGDLLWANEHDLMCPRNMVGTVDLLMVSHHGLDQSNSPALVQAVRPRVAVVQNGTTKGAAGLVTSFQTIRNSPGLLDLWELHWNYYAGVEQNSAGVFIANLSDPETIAANIVTPPGTGGRRGGAPGGGGAPPAGAPGAGAPPAGTPAGAPAAAPPAGAAVQGPPPGGAAQGAPPAGAPGGGGRGGQGGGAAAHTPAYWIKISARPDGTITVTNSRNGFTKTYKK